MELYRSKLFSDADLKAYYRLENVNDASPSGYNLANNGSVAFSAGKFNNAPTFDGTAKFLSIAGASCPNLNIAGSQTICFWFKPSAIADNWRSVLGKQKNDATTGFLFQHYTTNSKLSLRFRGLGGGGGSVDHTTVLSNGTWYFVCGRYDATAGTVSLFINTTKVGNTGVTGSVTSSANDSFCIGKGGDVADYAKGMIDDLAIFSRALTDQEVADLYADTLIKTVLGLAKASVKTKGGLAIASIKNMMELA